MMTVEDVRRVLGARVLVGEQYLDRGVRTACGADMMLSLIHISGIGAAGNPAASL